MRQTNMLKDMFEYTDLMLCWGCDQETTPWGWGGQYSAKVARHFRDLGVHVIFICPDLNYAAAIHADKWIPVLPNTDAALQLAIAYTWIVEDTFDKDYLDTHAVGFEPVSYTHLDVYKRQGSACTWRPSSPAPSAAA